MGTKPRLLEVDADGKIVVDVPLQPETDNAHMQTRMARKLASGNYLVPHLLAFKVKEYTPEGKVVSRSRPIWRNSAAGRENWPFTAIRLANGNTLVNLTHGNKMVEFDAEGKVVWKVSNDDFPEQAVRRSVRRPATAQRQHGDRQLRTQEASRCFEVTPDKKIVWTYTGPHRAPRDSDADDQRQTD